MTCPTISPSDDFGARPIMKSPWTRHDQAIGALIPWSWIGICVLLSGAVMVAVLGWPW